MNHRFQKSVMTLSLLVALGLSGCGGDNEPSAEIQSNVLNKHTSGVITGFGSVFINGVEYETDGARFIVDGVEGDESLLKLGMVVSLNGRVNSDGATGTAWEIEFDNEVEGVVLANNFAKDKTLNIMGLTVRIDDETVFESNITEISDMANIVTGNIIEVSGYSGGDGNILATRLEVKKLTHEVGDEVELKGKVGHLTATTFMIGDLTINYALALFDDDLSSGLTEGLFVEVKSRDGLNEAQQLIAYEIDVKGRNSKLERPKNSEKNDDIEIQGMVTSMANLPEFTVNGVPVILNDQTYFEYGDVSLLVNGMKLKVEGYLDENGKLVAEKIKLDRHANIKLEGKVMSTSLLDNTVMIFGQAIKINNFTMVKDKRYDDDDQDVKYNFGIDDLQVDNWLEVSAYLDESGQLVAKKMKREKLDASKQDVLQGQLALLDSTTLQFSIAGIVVDVANVTNVTFTEGMPVKLKGSFTDGVFMTMKASIDDDAEADDSKHEDESDNDDDQNDDSAVDDSENSESESDDDEIDD